MADFIAVIRRAVDGLTDNSPEMRVRVYDKARLAVQRQLENMKPQPPEDMLRRQMDKLESAIRQVEEEHAEALPAAEEIVVAVPPEIKTEPVYEPEPVREPEASAGRQAFQPSMVEAAPIEEPANSWAGEEDVPAGQAPSWQERDEQAPEQETAATEAMSWDDAEGSQPAEPTEIPPMTEPVPVSAGFVPVQHGMAGPAELEEPPAAEEEPREWPAEIDSEPEEWVDQDLEAQAGPHAPEEQQAERQGAEPEPEMPGKPDKSNFSAHEEEPDPSSVRMPKANFDESRALEEFGDLLDEPAAEPKSKATLLRPLGRVEPFANDFSWDAPFDDLPEHQTPMAFEDALAAKNAEIAEAKAAEDSRAAAQTAPAMPAASSDPMADFDEPIGYSRQRPGASEKTIAETMPADVKPKASKFAGGSFSTKPKQRGRRLIVVGVAGALSLIVAGGAFAVWYNFDRVNSFVDGLMAFGQPVADKPASGMTETAEPAITPAATAGTDNPEVESLATPSATNPAVDAAEPDPNAGTQVAAVQPTASGPQKFTQRLMVNGTETKGDDAINVDAALPEGTSVAGQTVASAAGDAAVNATDPAAQPKSTAIPPLAATQKMFLYEERLGQTSPTALTGTVAWSVKNETGSDGKAEPVIVGQISAPQRKITAMVSFKRNTDSSLPASHIIEIVFSLPKDFEGGNIESVERIALKQNEQDRGNALIAVPAKITDDFHMIALNDDKDAVKNNTELLRTRSWIDIPLTYRNGRRALITMEKGASGTAAFEKAMTEWSALGRTAEN